jgi:putative ABC transport system ATP-binding protein
MNDCPPDNHPAIVASGLMKSYEHGRIVALNGLDLQVARGEFVAICGPSGCGKSTLLNMITAIDRPDAGELSVCGQALEGMDANQADRFRATAVGLVFQLHNLLPNLTALENVQVPMLGNGRAGRERVNRAWSLLNQVGLENRAKSLPTTLSGGERQRVAIARALANEPKLLLADEPTGALDSESGKQLFDLLCKLQRESGMTLLVVTHDPAIASRAQRLVHLLDGRVVDGQDGVTTDPRDSRGED